MTTFTIVNPYTGHGIALVSGEDAAAVEAVADSVADAAVPGPHKAPANRGVTNSQPLGAALEKGGVTVALFETASDEEAAAVRAAVA